MSRAAASEELRSLRRARLEQSVLYLCTPDRPDLATFAAAALRGGIDIVQLRDKRLEARELLERAALLRRVVDDAGGLFVLNDRPDLALGCDADGVHVGQDDAPAWLARRVVGEDRLVGLSTHTPDELERALGEPVDYCSAGPVVETPTKPGRPGTGIGYVALATRQARCPVFVTGGVSPARVEELVAAGARRFVVVRWVCEADDPEAAARSLRRAVEAAFDRHGVAPFGR
jgi:thiamine-phosphate pyrophosphorylase